MDTFSMQCFLCVAKRLNLSKAADDMGISQPAMSAQIKKMELELSAALFVRDTHTVKLTAEGQIVREGFQRILKEYGAVERELEELKCRRKQLHIGWHGPTNWAGIQDLFFHLMQMHEGIYPRIKNATAGELLQALENGELDVAFLEEGMLEGHNRLKRVKLFRDSICFGVDMNHPLAQKSSVKPEELCGERIYYKEREYAGVKGSLNMLVQAGVPQENLFCLDKLDVSAVTVMTEGGMVVFPRSFKLWGNRTVAYVDLDLPISPISYCLAWRKDNDNPLLQNFVKCCKSFHWLTSPQGEEAVIG